MGALLLFASAAVVAVQDDRPAPFVVRVVDAATGRGVPLVELRTTNGIVFHTDNAGLVAFEEPGLLGRRVYVHVESHGYTRKADGFGYRGAALETKPGGEATIRIDRVNVAERLYRITGQGLYHHSIRAGRPVPLKHPALNAGVMGQDTAVAVVRGDRIRWFWGDTSLPGYPLGHFGTATATAARAGLDPSVGIDLEYAVDAKGLCRPTFDLGRPGAVWVHGGFALEDPEGRARILTQYERVKNVSERLEHGIAVFDEEKERFEPLVKLSLDEERRPFGQAFFVGEGEDRKVYFALPYPFLRVRAGWADALDPERYEGFTCIADGKVERDGAGRPVFAWRRGARPMTPARQAELVRKGTLKRGEGWIGTVDAATGKSIFLHRGSVRWNAHRKRYVMIATRRGGEDSALGEVYYVEAERPEGPWAKAVKVVTHRGYSFYNPVHHDFFDQEGGRLIYFEGTYTRTFSRAAAPTPRYDYNQVMYRLDLDDPRLEPARGD